ncbi:hypothetical protein PROFUN_08653 [Planoprotostelium fungivorum]|uniref:SAM-dependent MTase RsmB/NOP-type domain-containing protein n=1 Tax=Planoprotostelium fungivorum TaxID=1890364 RepID=A0A2P6NJ63_9EUKA|nr:hypothetical protein PROFUN_08653 [Planoprotostelium fungivorum]
MSRVYGDVASILDDLDKKKGSIKSLTFGSTSTGSEHKKQVYALVCETLKYREVLNEIINNTPLSEQLNQKQMSGTRQMLSILLYEFLFSPKADAGQGLKSIQGSGKVKKMIAECQTQITSCLARIKIRKKARTSRDLLPDHVKNAARLPRYVRVNTVRTTVDRVVEHLKSKGLQLLEGTHQLPEDDRKSFCFDEHIENLLLLPTNFDLHDDPFLLEGMFIIQDKASCMPSFILSPPAESHVIDACAAPGNKTTHLSSSMRNTGRIFAFEKDKRRSMILQKMLMMKDIDVIVDNFLKSDPTDEKFAQVEYVLVDPSCSGSGIVNRLDYLYAAPASTENEGIVEDNNRLESLAAFQLEAVLHAMKFPSVKRVVYSTCSIHQRENEDVVQSILKGCGGEFKLAPALPTWHRRGLPLFDGCEMLVRTDAKEDRTNGFFVSHFERTHPVQKRELPAKKETPSKKEGLSKKETPSKKEQPMKRKEAASHKRQREVDVSETREEKKEEEKEGEEKDRGEKSEERKKKQKTEKEKTVQQSPVSKNKKKNKNKIKQAIRR